MPRKIGSLLLGIGLAALINLPALASPRCVTNPQPPQLKDEFINWTMTAAPGSECLQGLRWSYMRIDQLAILKPPAKGQLSIVGYGFRYIADSTSREPDNFVVMIIGKNRHDAGATVLDVAVKPPGTMVSQLHQ